MAILLSIGFLLVVGWMSVAGKLGYRIDWLALPAGGLCGIGVSLVCGRRGLGMQALLAGLLAAGTFFFGKVLGFLVFFSQVTEIPLRFLVFHRLNRSVVREILIKTRWHEALYLFLGLLIAVFVVWVRQRRSAQRGALGLPS